MCLCTFNQRSCMTAKKKEASFFFKVCDSRSKVSNRSNVLLTEGALIQYECLIQNKTFNPGYICLFFPASRLASYVSVCCRFCSWLVGLDRSLSTPCYPHGFSQVCDAVASNKKKATRCRVSFLHRRNGFAFWSELISRKASSRSPHTATPISRSRLSEHCGCLSWITCQRVVHDSGWCRRSLLPCGLKWNPEQMEKRTTRNKHKPVLATSNETGGTKNPSKQQRNPKYFKRVGWRERRSYRQSFSPTCSFVLLID